MACICKALLHRSLGAVVYPAATTSSIHTSCPTLLHSRFGSSMPAASPGSSEGVRGGDGGGGELGGVLGIRREESSVWERRAPLSPNHVQSLVSRGVKVRKTHMCTHMYIVFSLRLYIQYIPHAYLRTMLLRK